MKARLPRALFVLGTFAWLGPAAAESPPRWTAETPDAMIDLAVARARNNGPDALAAVALIHELSERASHGRAKAAFDELAPIPNEVGRAARWLSVQHGEAEPRGLVRDLVVWGPFPDTGGGLLRREGPEVDGFDPEARYDFGAYRARHRAVPKDAVTADGLPLDLFIAPRSESCTYLATRVFVDAPEPFVVHVASSGSVRLFWNRTDVAHSEEVHPGHVFDRLAARIEPTPGEHLLGIKVCSGALADEGRARLRVTDEGGEPLTLRTSADFEKPPELEGKAKLTRLDTPLETALRLRGKASPDAMLASALTRVFGRADDLRSPRAPGLLETVMATRSLSTDRVAIAGFASPFASAKTEWLNLALSRAIREKDARAEVFARKELVRSRLDAKLVDFAWAGLSEGALATAHDADAVLLRARVQAAMPSATLRRLAMAEVARLVEREGPRAPVAAYRLLAELARGLDPQKEAEARERLARLMPREGGAAYVRAMSIFDEKKLLRAAERAAPTSADELLDIGETLASAGLHDAALQLFERASYFAPNLPRTFTNLATELFRAGDEGRAEEALVRARELAPEDPSLRAALELRARSESDAPFAGDLRYLTPPEVILARKEREPARVGHVFARDLHWLRAVTFHPDRRASQLIQYAREIVIEPRSSAELYEMLPQEGESIEILEARVHRRSGGIALAEEQGAEMGHAYVRWPKLERGDVVEVVLRTWTKGPVGRRGDAPFFFIDYAGAFETRPLLYNEVVIDAPKDGPLAFDVLHGEPDHGSDEIRGDRRIVRLVWDRPRILREEPLSPQPSELFPTVIGSSFQSFADFRAWYQSASEGFTEPDEQLRRLAIELTRGKATRNEKVRALFDFVADEIRYVNYVSGEAWLPNRPQQVLARRQGDCDDKAILLIALLRAIGVEAKLALVQTRLAGQPSLLTSEKAVVPYFDHGIAYIPASEGHEEMWLDPTNPQSRLGPLPSMDARAMAFFIDDGPAKPVRTPSSRPEDHGIESTWTLKIDDDGNAHLEADELFAGDHAFFARTNLSEPGARASFIEQSLVASFFPTIRVGDDAAFAGELPQGKARIRYEAISRGFARREGESLVISLARSMSLSSQLAPLPRRKLPLVLPSHWAPSHQKRKIRLLLPEGYESTEKEGRRETRSPRFGHAAITIAREGRALVVEQELTIDASTIEASDYPAFRAWLGEVDALFSRSLRWKTSASPSKGVARKEVER